MQRVISKIIVLFALVVLTASCAAKPIVAKVVPLDKATTFILHVDDLFSPADRPIVIDSFVEWERDTHGLIRFVVSKRKWNSNTQEVPEAASNCTHEVYVMHVTSKDKSVKALEKVKGKETGRPFTVLGYTHSSCDGRLVAFVMDRLTNPVLLRNVGVHEAGHLIGLDHIPVPNESVMFPAMNMASKCPTVLDMKQLCMMYGCDWRDMIMCK